jgi:flagellar assembly factor FliW
MKTLTRITTTRYGQAEDIAIDESAIVHFPDGIVGLPDSKRYAVIPADDAEGSLCFIQSVDAAEICFVAADPGAYFPEYALELSDGEAARIGLSGPGDARVLVLLTLGEDIRDTTANLMGPIVLNTRTGKGFQVVLTDLSLPTRAPIYRETAVQGA